MLRLLCYLLLLSCSLTLTAQTCGGGNAFQILHFTKTNGFDHNTRTNSHQLFVELGLLEGFTVTDTEDAAVFDDLSTLLSYEVIVFSNTSGENLFNAQQRQNIEDYMEAGGAFLGIHAATDTYRSQSWPFYNQLVGGIVQTNPNHTSRFHVDTMDVIVPHPSTANLPDPWIKQEEYYYWELNGGQLDPDIIETLRVRPTGNNSYDAARPMSWYKTFSGGGRSYYTALGHDNNNYTDPGNDFRQLLRDALCWCVEASAALPVDGLYAQVRAFEQYDQINWQARGESPVVLRLYGGPDQEERQLLLEREIDGRQNSGILEFPRSRASRTEWYYYQLETVDNDGGTFRGDWLASPPLAADRPLACLVVSVSGAGPRLLISGLEQPINVLIVDQQGRAVRRLKADNGYLNFGYRELRSGYYAFVFEGVALASLAFVKP